MCTPGSTRLSSHESLRVAAPSQKVTSKFSYCASNIVSFMHHTRKHELKHSDGEQGDTRQDRAEVERPVRPYPRPIYVTLFPG